MEINEENLYFNIVALKGLNNNNFLYPFVYYVHKRHHS